MDAPFWLPLILAAAGCWQLGLLGLLLLLAHIVGLQLPSRYSTSPVMRRMMFSTPKNC